MSFKSDIQIAVNALERFNKAVVEGEIKVINQEKPVDIIQSLKLDHFTAKGGLTGNALKEFLEQYFNYVTSLHHPKYLGHQCAPPYYSSALGTLINGFLNNVSSIYEMGPASASLEHYIINWMLEKVGWPIAPLEADLETYKSPHGAGILVNGGSIANLTALIIARTQIAPGVWKNGNPGNLGLLLPAQSHYSLAKAAGILGLGANSVHLLDVDSDGRLIPDKIVGRFKRIIDKGLLPMALVANACSTSVGIYDPLDEIAEFCTTNNLWFHVDGAHGASALISETHKGLLKGVEKADSLTWDAHKLLQTSSLCAALLVKNHVHLNDGFQIHHDASYIFHKKDQLGFDTIHNTIETTKSGLGEKLFFVMGALGESGMAQYVDKQYKITKEAYKYVSNCSEFECPVLPESNILCFRIAGQDELQIAIRNELISEGRFYITTVKFKERQYLRLVFMNQNTSLKTIKELISEIRRIGKFLRSAKS